MKTDRKELKRKLWEQEKKLDKWIFLSAYLLLALAIFLAVSAHSYTYALQEAPPRYNSPSYHARKGHFIVTHWKAILYSLSCFNMLAFPSRKEYQAKCGINAWRLWPQKVLHLFCVLAMVALILRTGVRYIVEPYAVWAYRVAVLATPMLLAIIARVIVFVLFYYKNEDTAVGDIPFT